MNFLIPFLLFMNFSLFAQTCVSPSFSSWEENKGHYCTQVITQKDDPENCLPLIFPQLKNFEDLLGKKDLPWWAVQGKLLFPNLEYPGVWKNNKIDASFYPGTGEVFAGKPNVYIQSIHHEKKMKFHFPGEASKNFLATTPMLSERNSWEGKIIDGDKFEIEGTLYDYLFYDVRLPKEGMQFTHGVCVNRSESIDFMLKDLRAMNYPPISLSDFEEHWRVKIPDYPVICIYPQYNKELDEVLPVELEIEQATFTRVLYVLVPHRESPEFNSDSSISLPQSNPESIRPSLKITRENMFKEWGVAFLGE